MVVEHIMNFYELNVTSAPTMSFTSYGSLLNFFHHNKNNELFIEVLFKHPIKTFEHDNRIIVIKKNLTRQQIH